MLVKNKNKVGKFLSQKSWGSSVQEIRNSSQGREKKATNMMERELPKTAAMCQVQRSKRVDLTRSA